MSSLSIIIPAYNEAERLPLTLHCIADYLKLSNHQEVEILVIDDGSTDQTIELTRQQEEMVCRAGASLKVLINPGNRGKGYSVRRGFQQAKNEWVLFTDADLSAPIEELDKLIERVTQSASQIAIGSRALDRSLVGVHQSKFREMSGRIFNLHMRLFTGLRIADTQCGFKLFTHHAARQIAALQRLERFGFDVEQLFLASKLGLSVVEVPVIWNNVQGSSVKWNDGLKTFADVLQVKWNDLQGFYS